MEYSGDTVDVLLPSGGSAVVKEITGKAENIIADENLIKQGTMVTKLIRQLTVELNGETPNEKEIANLYTADRRAILLAARNLTYGPEMTFDVSCINRRCERTTEFAINLDNTEDIVWTQRKENLEVEVFLPSSKKTAKIHPIRGVDETKLVRNGTDDRLTDAMLVYLSEIEGVSDAMWRSFLNEASGRDTRAIREAAKNVEFGPETNVEVECPHCGTKQTVELTNEYNFFFPTT